LNVEPGSHFLVLGSWFLVLGSQFSVLGSQFLVLGSWFLVLGSQFLVLGSWFSVLGSWFSNMLTDILTYWLAALALGIVGLPAARLLLGALPDRGYAFARSLGLLLTGYVAWLAAMFGLASFGAPLIVAAGAAVFIGGMLALRHSDATEPAQLFGWMRTNWRVVVFYEALFAAALVFLALLRAQEYGFVGPHPWGTERPMDYAFFNAIRASTVFPPHDPWMSGYSINYYYFGYLLTAAVSLVTGVHPAVGYNLSLALIFALTALGVAGVVCNLAAIAERSGDPRSPAVADADASAARFRAPDRESDAAGAALCPAPAIQLAFSRVVRTTVAHHRLSIWIWQSAPRAEHGALPMHPLQSPPEVAAEDVSTETDAEREQPRIPDTSPDARRRMPWQVWIAALLTVVAVLLAGNQAGTLQIIVGDERIVALDGVQLSAAIAQALSGAETIALPYPARTGAGEFGEITSLKRSDRTADFNWWWPSRVVWDERPGWNPETQQIEMVRGYAITEFPFFSFWLGDMHPHVMALPFGVLALALALNIVARSTALHLWRSRVTLILAGIVLGSLYMINSWDLPTYLLIFLGALAFKTATQPDMALAGAAFPNMPLITRLTPPWRSYLANALLIIVASVLLIAPFLLTFTSLVGGRAPLIDLPLISGITRFLGFVTDRTDLHNFLIIFGVFLTPLVGLTVALARDMERTLLIVSGITVVVGAFIGFPLAALLPLGLAAVLLARRHSDHPADAFVFVMFALGCAICLGVEVVYIRDVFENRMNTVFKFYYQIWLIWGVTGGYAAWRLVQRAVTLQRTQPLRLIGSLVAPALALVLLASGLTYPWLTAGKAFTEGRHVGLEGRTPRERTSAGAEAIAWIRANTPGDAVILEAVGPSYDTAGMGYGGVSSSTGRATVMGWEGHQQQWRGGDPTLLAEIAPRAADVATIYSTTNVAQARALLATYGVDYIYVGETERQTYPAEGLAKLPELGEVVFQNEEVTIYRVRTS
jgi:YYY domain-containing protein